MLTDLEFSDIYLLPNGNAFLKGTPGQDQHLVQVPDEHQNELEVMLEFVQEQFKDKDPSRSLRINHLNCNFRASRIKDVSIGEAFSLRRLAASVPALKLLGLPVPVVKWLTDKYNCNHGLVIFSGGQCDGKTTAASSLVQERLNLYGGLALTYEIPPEMPLTGAYDNGGLCFQADDLMSESELPIHIARSHRFAPNIIYIGEIRTKYAATEALRVALGSKQQLVVTTIHGDSLISALERLLTWAKLFDGEIAYQNLSQTLVAIIHLNLSVDEQSKLRTLKTPEYLLMPFGDDFQQIRSLIRKGNLAKLEDEISSQLALAAYNPSLYGV